MAIGTNATLKSIIDTCTPQFFTDLQTQLERAAIDDDRESVYQRIDDVARDLFSCLKTLNLVSESIEPAATITTLYTRFLRLAQTLDAAKKQEESFSQIEAHLQRLWQLRTMPLPSYGSPDSLRSSPRPSPVPPSPRPTLSQPPFLGDSVSTRSLQASVKRTAGPRSPMDLMRSFSTTTVATIAEDLERYRTLEMTVLFKLYRVHGEEVDPGMYVGMLSWLFAECHYKALQELLRVPDRSRTLDNAKQILKSKLLEAKVEELTLYKALPDNTRALIDTYSTFLDKQIEAELQSLVFTSSEELENLMASTKKRMRKKEFLHEPWSFSSPQKANEARALPEYRNFESVRQKLIQVFTVSTIWEAAEKDDVEYLESSRPFWVQWMDWVSFEKSKTLNGQNPSGQTPLHIASSRGHTDTVVFLLGSSASFTLPDKKGFLPQHLASRAGFLGICRLLVTAGAAVDPRDNCQRTPLLLAAHKGHNPVVRYLSDSGANPNAQSLREKGGITPLIAAVLFNHKDVFTTLINLLDIEVSRVDSRGYSALYHAVNEGFIEYVGPLLSHDSFRSSKNAEDPNSLDNLLTLNPRENWTQIKRLLQQKRDRLQ